MHGVFMIGKQERQLLAELRQFAQEQPISYELLLQAATWTLAERPKGWMERYTIFLPMHYLVTFSIECQRPEVPCRHLSMSTETPNALPHPEAVRMVMRELGFVNELEHCEIWKETLTPTLTAINVLEPVSGDWDELRDTPAPKTTRPADAAARGLK